MQLEILYEDPHCLVINKPADLAVQPGHGMRENERTLLDDIREHFVHNDIPFSSETILVHRLDKETTGCLLIAKNRDIHEILQKQFENRTIEKNYLALVAGVPSHEHAIIDAPIGRSISERTKMGVSRIATRREAQTQYRTIGHTSDIALLMCTPRSGRTHQIRVHLTSIGHPILGDKKYSSGLSKDLAEHHMIQTLCLHAWKLSFDSPIGQRVHVEAPLPKELRKILDEVGIIMTSHHSTR